MKNPSSLLNPQVKSSLACLDKLKQTEKMDPCGSWLIFSLAGLVRHRAGSLAGRLAGSLALAAAAGSQSLSQVLFIDSFNMYFSHF